MVSGVAVGSNYSLFDPPGNGFIIEGSVGIGVTVPVSKLQVADSILPSASSTYDIGSAEHQWKDLHMSGQLYQNGKPMKTSQWATVSDGSCNIYFMSNVGIGVTNPSAALQVAGDILPSACNVFNLGSPSHRFKDLYLSGKTIHMDGLKISNDGSNNMSITDATGALTNVVIDTIQFGDPASGSSFIIQNNGGTLVTKAVQSDGTPINETILQKSDALTSIINWDSNAYGAYLTNANVGIGTTIPSAGLHVHGDALVSSLRTNRIGTSSGSILDISAAVLSNVAHVYAGTVGSPVLGHFEKADTLTTPRTISLSGPVTGTTFFDGSCNASIQVTVANDAITLGTHTTGNYVATVLAGTGIHVAGSGTENASVSLSNTGVWSFNNRRENVTLTGSDVQTALGYTPFDQAGGQIAGNTFVAGNLTASNITVLGDFTTIDAITTQYSNVSIENTLGAGPALRVTQKTVNNGSGTIAEFIDDDDTNNPKVPILIVADNKKVGVNTSMPSTALHVEGTIQATSMAATTTALASNLNADLLDGQQGTFYQNATNINAGTLGVAYGGTGATTLASSKLLVGNGTSAVTTPSDLHWTGANLGIGSTNPATKLDVVGTIQAASFVATTTALASNLNADLLDGYNFSAFMLSNTPLNATQLPSVGISTGTYGSATAIPSITVDTYGRITGISTSAATWSVANGDTYVLNGNVGIGTTVMTHRMHIYTNNSTNTNYEQGGIYLENAGAGEVGIAMRTSSVPAGNVWVMGINNAQSRLDVAYGTIANQINDTPFLSILTGGNIGIGTSVANQKLDVNGTVRTNSQFISTVATGTAPLVVSSTTKVANLNADQLDGLDSTAFMQTTTTLNVTQLPTVGNVTAGSYGSASAVPTIVVDGYGRITGISTSAVNAGQSTQWTTVNTIDSVTNGNVGIGTTTTVSGYKLYVQGAIYASGDITGLSDERYKSNMQVLDAPLDKISQLNGYTFERIDEDAADPKRRHVGLLAQEVQRVLPEAIMESSRGLSVAYGNMAGLFVEAIKELHAKIKSIEEKLELVLHR